MDNITLQDVSKFLSETWIQEDGIDGKILKDSYKELNDYRISHAKRFLRSLQLIAHWAPKTRPLRVLEIGSAPYFFTALLAHYFDCEIVGGNIPAVVWPGTEGAGTQQRVVRLRYDNSGTTLDFPIYVFNVEKDEFPFSNDSFDIVLAMEVIEHLAYSPTHMLAESQRVLKPGGRLFLSTPNAVDMRKTLSLLLNRSGGFHYSGYGIYGRHQREFTLKELRDLTAACGYRILDSHRENIFIRKHYKFSKRIAFDLLNFLSGLPLPYLRAKREYLFVVAEPVGPPQWVYPENLYFYPHLYPRP